MARLSGVVRVDARRAALETARGVRTLIPYPREATQSKVAISDRQMELMGTRLFGYLNGHEVAIIGDPSGSAIYNARIARSGLSIEDVKLAPQSRDKFAQEIRRFFRKDAGTVARKLNDLGIRTVSALYHRIRDDYGPEVKAFADYLAVERRQIREFINALAADADNRALVAASPRFPVRRGVSLDTLREVKGVPVKMKAPSAPPPFPKSAVTKKLPSKVDLTGHVSPVKNQGVRGTCVAHAGVACLETALIKAGHGSPRRLDLSEQYLYFACKQLDGSPGTEGTFIEYAVEVLVNGVPRKGLPGGVCSEKDWPYVRLPVTGNESQGPPPPRVKKAFAAERHARALSFGKVKHNSIVALKTALAGGSCVGLSVYTYHFWTDDFAWREGGISLPLSIRPDGAHAICLVGYRDADATHGDGYFIFKNSWDVTWGYGRPDPGFGSLPYRYVIKEAIEAFTVQV